ncbi:MAG: protein kinase [Eubacteriales bacterium]|nr:protein kinase [Eubacteriales bacterium]
MLKENDTFRLIHSLGFGAFAQTWRASVIDKDLAKKWGVDEVAIKIPLDKDKEKALIDEIKLNGALYMKLTEMESKNIIRFISFDKFDDWIVMVMEYAENGSLRDMIGKAGRGRTMKPDKAVGIIRGILEGLSVIHNNYIIHRDIKPENILMVGEIPKISDLSVGRILRPNEMASTTTGTIFYMAPEVLHTDYEGVYASYNADIWSVGITLYEMLFGRYPFGVNEVMPVGDIVKKLANRNNVLEFPRNDKIPPELEKIIVKSLQRNPNERYEHVEEILEDINRLSSPDKEEIEKAIAQIHQLVDKAVQPDQAEAQFKEILKDCPDSSRIYLNIGEFFNKCGSYDKAIDSFKKGLEIDPGSAILHWGHAMACHKKKNNVSAVKSIQKALDCGLEPSLERYAKLLMETLKSPLKKEV